MRSANRFRLRGRSMPEPVAKPKKTYAAIGKRFPTRSFPTRMPDGSIGVVTINAQPEGEEIPSRRRTTQEIVDEFLRDTPLHMPAFPDECASQLMADMARARLSTRAKWQVYQTLLQSDALSRATLRAIRDAVHPERFNESK